MPFDVYPVVVVRSVGRDLMRALSVAMLVAACETAAAQSTPTPPEKTPSPSSTTVSKFGANVNELKIVDQKPGTVSQALSGKAVVVHYTGWLYDPAAADGHGTKFDSSVDRDVPFEFPLGGGRVIKGWDEGVAGMKVGGKRTLIIPPEQGYGAAVPAASFRRMRH